MRASVLCVVAIACGGKAPVAKPAIDTPAKPTAAPPPADAAIAAPKPHAKGKPSSTLISRLEFFANARYTNVRLSPDGKRLAWIEPRNNIAMPYVAPLGDLKSATLVAADTTRAVTLLSWTADSKHVVYLQDPNGDGNTHVFRWDLDTAKTIDLVPIKGARVDLIGLSPRKPQVAVIAINDRDPQASDLYSVNLKTGDKKRVVVNDSKLEAFVLDNDLAVRFATKVLPDGGAQILANGPGGWKVWDTVGPDDRDTRVVGVDAAGKRAYLVDTRARDTAAVFSIDIASKQRTLLAEDPGADASSAFLDPATGSLAGVAFSRLRSKWRAVDDPGKGGKNVAADIAALDKVADGSWVLTSATSDGQKWLVAFATDTQPGKYYLYDRKKKTATYVLDMTPSLESYPLARMHAHELAARDKLPLVIYITLPRDRDPDDDGVPDRPLPLVVIVGPDPTARETYAYDPLHQLLASRGYAVMSVNFRGVNGYGKAFARAGALQWGKAMQDDLVDAARWAAAQRIADPAKIGIVGVNYGGYAALMADALAPDTFACAIDVLGPADLVTYSKLTAPNLMTMFRQKIGDPTTPDGIAALRAASPIAHAGEMTKPLLVVHSAETVAGADVAKLVELASKRAPVTFVVFPDEPAAIARPENNIAMIAAIEGFFSEQLGGWFEPLDASIARSTSLQIKVGAENLPGF